MLTASERKLWCHKVLTIQKKNKNKQKLWKAFYSANVIKPLSVIHSAISNTEERSGRPRTRRLHSKSCERNSPSNTTQRENTETLIFSCKSTSLQPSQLSDSKQTIPEGFDPSVRNLRRNEEVEGSKEEEGWAGGGGGEVMKEGDVKRLSKDGVDFRSPPRWGLRLEDHTGQTNQSVTSCFFPLNLQVLQVKSLQFVWVALSE